MASYDSWGGSWGASWSTSWTPEEAAAVIPPPDRIMYLQPENTEVFLVHENTNLILPGRDRKDLILK